MHESFTATASSRPKSGTTVVAQFKANYAKVVTKLIAPCAKQIPATS